MSDLTEIIDPGDDDDVSPIVEKPKVPDQKQSSEDISRGPIEQAPPTTVSPKKEDYGAPAAPGENANAPTNEDDDDEFSKVLGTGVSAVQAGAQSLYGFFVRGVETVQHTSVADLALQGIEKSKQVIAQGVKAGQDVADKSLEALEKVGEKAMEVLASSDAQEPAEDVAKDASASNASASGAPASRAPAPAKRIAPAGVITGDTPKKKAKELSYESAFEEKGGSASLQSLENLSIECTYLGGRATSPLLTCLAFPHHSRHDEDTAVVQKI